MNYLQEKIDKIVKSIKLRREQKNYQNNIRKLMTNSMVFFNSTKTCYSANRHSDKRHGESVNRLQNVP